MKFFNVLLGVVFCLVSCNNQKSLFKLQRVKGSALGTTYGVVYFSSKKIVGIEKSLDSLFSAVNNSMSTYILTSDISKINRGDRTLVVDQMFRDVFKLSKEIHKETKGYFDPTVGKLVNAWGFGPKKLKLTMNNRTVDSLRQYVGFSKVSLAKNNILYKENSNIILDFNAIAKGYCIDRIATYLDTKNIKNYLIELGGELIAKGENLKKQSSWKVGIDDPNQKETRTLISTLSLNNRAMATSGNYRKFRIDKVTGKKYVHTINPLTGYTQISQVLSVSVLANNCATADAYATAFMAMPLEETKKIVELKKELDIYIVYSNPKSKIEVFTSKGFKEVLNKIN